MKNEKTTWTSPKTNIIAAVNDLRGCLASGHKARLIRILNEDCQHPILLDKDDEPKDFREYEFSIGTLRTKEEIKNDTSMSEFEKTLSLEYHACFGEQDAIDKYYQTGVLSKGNFKGMGRSHLVKVSDMIEYLQRSNDPKDKEYARLWYHYTDQTDARHFYDTFRLKNRQQRTVKIFKHKLWAVEMLGKDSPAISQPRAISALLLLIKIIVYPAKFIPSRRVLDMGNYKVITYRVGDVTNGYSIDIHKPKKFSFRTV
jgi:hypothetical protein